MFGGQVKAQGRLEALYSSHTKLAAKPLHIAQCGAENKHRESSLALSKADAASNNFLVGLNSLSIIHMGNLKNHCRGSLFKLRSPATGGGSSSLSSIVLLGSGIS